MMFSFRVSPVMELFTWAILATVLAVWSSILLSVNLQGSPHKPLHKTEHSSTGDDFPSSYPLTLDTTFRIPEDTTHYQIYAADGAAEWETQFPPGGGWVRLGSHNRTFQLTVFHELWCLGLIRNAVAVQSVGEDIQRLHNCFNYLREMVLCRADVTLEDVLDEQHSVNHMFPHVCKDWEAVYAETERNHRQHF